MVGHPSSLLRRYRKEEKEKGKEWGVKVEELD